jgi:hypothetical protein
MRPVVLVIPELREDGVPSACTYIRLILPFSRPVMQQCADVRFGRAEDIDLVKPDVVVFQRLAVRSVAALDQLERTCRRLGTVLIYDLDDNLMAMGEDHPEHATYKALVGAVFRAVVTADQVWVSTQTLKDQLLGIATNLCVVPNDLDHRVWRPRSAARSVADRARTRFVYVGTMSHQPDLSTIVAPAFQALSAEFGARVELDVIGVIDAAAAGAAWRVKMPPWRYACVYPAFARWLSSLRPYDVGLAPLLDSPFNRAKSNIKWLEYSALGLATIAADLPPYRPADSMVLVQPSAEGFLQAMRTLVLDRQRLATLQCAALGDCRRNLESAEASDLRPGLISGLESNADRPGPGSGAPGPGLASPGVARVPAWIGDRGGRTA